ncbi:hypothetical protein GW750_03980 [bacterium]|nr:hypothetical protein [bacterium]
MWIDFILDGCLILEMLPQMTNPNGVLSMERIFIMKIRSLDQVCDKHDEHGLESVELRYK